jgi:hypothetical protein
MAPQNESKDPSFIDQAFAIIEKSYSTEDPRDKHGMTIADHKLLCQILNAHEGFINENIVERFYDKVAEHYDPIMRSLEKLERGQDAIAKKIRDVEDNYIELGAKFKTLGDNVDDIRGMIPDCLSEKMITLQKSVTSLKKQNSFRAIAIRIAIAVAISVLLALLIHYYYL